MCRISSWMANLYCLFIFQKAAVFTAQRKNWFIPFWNRLKLSWIVLLTNRSAEWFACVQTTGIGIRLNKIHRMKNKITFPKRRKRFWNFWRMMNTKRTYWFFFVVAISDKQWLHPTKCIIIILSDFIPSQCHTAIVVRLQLILLSQSAQLVSWLLQAIHMLLQVNVFIVCVSVCIIIL